MSPSDGGGTARPPGSSYHPTPARPIPRSSPRPPRTSLLPIFPIIFLLSPLLLAPLLDTQALELAVTSTASSGAGTLRAAIAAANAQPGPHIIRFQLPPPPPSPSTPPSTLPTIALTSALPILIQLTTIDGTLNTSSSLPPTPNPTPTPGVRITLPQDANRLAPILQLASPADGSILRNLELAAALPSPPSPSSLPAPYACLVLGAAHVVVEHSSFLDCQGYGVRVLSHNVTLRSSTIRRSTSTGVYLDPTATSTRLEQLSISAAGAYGIVGYADALTALHLEASFCAIDGLALQGGRQHSLGPGLTLHNNSRLGLFLVDTHASHLRDVACLDNPGGGLQLGSSNDNVLDRVTVAGTSAGFGVVVLGSRNTFTFLRVGVDATGTQPWPNAQGGVSIISGSRDNLIGEGCIVSASGFSGITIQGSDNRIEGSPTNPVLCGLDVTGRLAMGNGNHGITVVTSATNTTITHIVASANAGSGIHLDSTTNVSISHARLGVGAFNDTLNLSNQRHGISASLSTAISITLITSYFNIRHGLFSSASQLTMTDSSLRFNLASGIRIVTNTVLSLSRCQATRNLVSALDVDTAASITAADSSFSTSLLLHGARLNAAAGPAAFTNCTFDVNNGNGALALQGGSGRRFEQCRFRLNLQSGLFNQATAVLVRHAELSGNGDTGLVIQGQVDAEHVVASSNTNVGVLVQGAEADGSRVAWAEMSSNGHSGLGVGANASNFLAEHILAADNDVVGVVVSNSRPAAGSLQLWNVTAVDNGDTGVQLEGGNVHVTQLTTRGNSFSGCAVFSAGNITLTDVAISDNGFFPQTLRGSGIRLQRASIIASTPSTPITNPNSTGPLLYVFGPSADITLQDVEVRSTNSSRTPGAPAGIHFNLLRDSTLSNITSIGHAGSGLFLEKCTNVTLRSSTIADNGADGVALFESHNITLSHLRVGGLPPPDGKNTHLNNTTPTPLLANRGHGISTDLGSTRITAHACHVFNNGDVGISMFAPDSVLTNVVSENNTRHGIVLGEASYNILINSSRASGNGGSGLRVEGSNNMLLHSLFGTDSNGTVAHPNSENGIAFSLASANNVVANCVTSGNIINGMAVGASHTTIRDTLVGLSASGDRALGNGGVGIEVLGDDTQIHGCSVAANAYIGISLFSSRNVVRQTRVGLDANAAQAFSNTGGGIIIQPASANNTIDSCMVGGNNVSVSDRPPSFPLRNPTAKVSFGIVVFGPHNVIRNCTLGLLNIISGRHWSPAPNRGGMVVDGPEAVGNLIEGSVMSGNLNVGLLIQNASGTVVRDSFFGTDPTGYSAVPNTGPGISVTTGSRDTMIGPGVLSSGNLRDGIAVIFSFNTVVLNSSIGVTTDGSAALPNQRYGVIVDRSNDTRLGTVLISGNALAGLRFLESFGLLLSNCLVGTDARGSRAVPNNSTGLLLEHSTQVIISGTLIAGNRLSGLMGTNCADTVVFNSFFGVDRTGAYAIPNLFGVFFDGPQSGNITVSGCVVSGNRGTGMSLEARGGITIVSDCHVGLNFNGTAAIPNGGDGLVVNHRASKVQVGPANVVSGNRRYGIVMQVFGSIVSRNLVGTAADGRTAVPNSEDGIFLDLSSSNNQIEGNLVAGNALSGITIHGTRNVVRNNIVGLDVAGQPLGNGAEGVVFLAGGSRNTVEGGFVAHNRGNGLTSFGPGNAIRGVDIYLNGGSGLRVGAAALANNITGIDAHNNTRFGVWIEASDTLLCDSRVRFNGEEGLYIAAVPSTNISFRDCGNEFTGNRGGTLRLAGTPSPTPSPTLSPSSAPLAGGSGSGGGGGGGAAVIGAVVAVVLVVAAAVVAAVLVYHRRRAQQDRDVLLGELAQLMKVPNLRAQEIYVSRFAGTLGGPDECNARLEALRLDRARLTMLDKELGHGEHGSVVLARMEANGAADGGKGSAMAGRAGGSRYGQSGPSPLATLLRRGGGSVAADRTAQTAAPGLVAVKMLHEGQFSGQACVNLLLEARVLAMLKPHEHVVGLQAVQIWQAPVLVVLEFCDGGDLRNFLREGGGGGGGAALATRELVHCCMQVARGMEFLHSNMLVHRDLAARNVLVSRTGCRVAGQSCAVTVKLADLGLTRAVSTESDYYHKQSDDRVPVKWMCPQALALKRFTKKSDVWSFGVLMWEVLTRGQAPYADLLASEVLIKTSHGYRLPPPAEGGETVYRLMLQCWQQLEAERPAFAELHGELLRVLVEGEDKKEGVGVERETDDEFGMAVNQLYRTVNDGHDANGGHGALNGGVLKLCRAGGDGGGEDGGSSSRSRNSLPSSTVVEMEMTPLPGRVVEDGGEEEEEDEDDETFL